MLAAGVALAAPAAKVAPPGKIRVTPTGTVKRVRQVVAVFPEAMVALGDPRPAVDPFEVDCPEPGTGRWVDTRTWTYDFARDLPGGLQCRFRLAAGIHTLAGKAVADPSVYELSTGGPAVRTTEPSE